MTPESAHTYFHIACEFRIITYISARMITHRLLNKIKSTETSLGLRHSLIQVRNEFSKK